MNWLNLASTALSPGAFTTSPEASSAYLRVIVTEKIVRLFKKEGKGVRELAQVFGISQRTVQRALKNYRLRQEDLWETREDKK